MRDNNKGFSLVELLVVIGIMAIVTGIAAASLSYIARSNVEKASKSLAAAINTARAQSMAKGQENGKLTLYVENGSVFYTIGTSTEKTRIATGIISFANETATLAGVDPTTVGSIVKSPVTNATYTLEFNSAGMLDTSVSSSYIFAFYKGTRSALVYVYPNTGKIYTTVLYN